MDELGEEVLETETDDKLRLWFGRGLSLIMGVWKFRYNRGIVASDKGLERLAMAGRERRNTPDIVNGCLRLDSVKKENGTRR